MPDFRLRVLNIPAERLFSPKRRLEGVHLPIWLDKLLPFSIERFEDINEETDIINFLNYFDNEFYDNLSDFKAYVDEDSLCSAYVKDPDEHGTQETLVALLKYVFVAKRLLQLVTFDDALMTYCIPFLAEGISDLECSYYLMQGDYFKQSLQMLRNTLEVTLFHAFFALKYLDDEMLDKALNERYPGIKEIIIFLRTENLLIPSIEQEYFKYYKTLSTAVHSEISKLSVSHRFQSHEPFSEWSKSFMNVSALYIRSILQMLPVGV